MKHLEATGVYFLDVGAVADTNAHEVLTCAVKYMFPARILGGGYGLPTAWSATPMNRKIKGSGATYVWPHPGAPTHGICVEPLDYRVPVLAEHDSELGEMLTLVDSIRLGGAREREVASRLIAERLGTQRLITA